MARTGDGGNIRGNSFQTTGTRGATGMVRATGMATARASGNRHYTSPNSPSPKKTADRIRIGLLQHSNLRWRS